MSGGGGDEEKKPYIHLNVLGQDGGDVFFRIKRSTRLIKLMVAYCDRQSVKLNSIVWLFNGIRLRGEQTPDEWEMEDGDVINAMFRQIGGNKGGSI